MNRKLSLILLLACAIGFTLGIGQLFKLRFETGDVYPAYSSLRSDPLGVSALYESLGKLPGITVSRDFSSNDRLPEGQNVAYLHLAGNRNDWEELSEESFKEVEAFLKRGGRLVVALSPQTSKTFDSFSSRQKGTSVGNPNNKKSKSDKPAKKKKMTGEDSQTVKTVSLTERWGFGFNFKEMKKNSAGSYKSLEVHNSDVPSLPSYILWHSGLVMTNLDDAWQVIYARDSNAVLAERKFGPGSVILSTDSFFLSNEALEKDRHVDLLAWVVGPSRQIFFDEAHLGIVDNPGVATLMRNYRLHGLMAGLLLLAGLFIWKNSVSFAPAHKEPSVDAAVIGKDSATGFVNLLRRHIKSDDLLNVCVAEWKKSLGRGKFPSARIERVESLLQSQNAMPPNDRNPIAAYRAICQALKESSEFQVSSSKLGMVSPTRSGSDFHTVREQQPKQKQQEGT